MTIQLMLTKAVNLQHYGKKSGDIITLDLEKEYMPLCLSSEIYENDSRTPPEAKKAQAIACRTYVLTLLQKGITINDTATYQAFNWKALSSIPNCVKASQATEGEVLTSGGGLITAWYSASNGGETKRSDQAWSAYKPWTIGKSDPWDVAGRAKWGQVARSHGVGMSQVGAAYAASIGKSCREILMFYYINTEITPNYGAGSAQTDQLPPPKNPEGKRLIQVSDLCAYGLKAVGCGYCYGASGEVCSLARRQEWAAWNPSQKTNLLGICAKWDGKRVWDCSGLFRGAWRTLLTYRSGGATTIFNTWCSKTGEIATMPDAAGTAVFRAGSGNTKQHIGLYVGDGMVVDARGSSYGVLHKHKDQFPWTHWGQLEDVDYTNSGQPQTPPPEEGPGTLYYGIVRTKTGGGIGLWTSNSKTKKIAQINDGQIVSVLSTPDAKGFVRASFADQAGVVDGQYIFRTA